MKSLILTKPRGSFARKDFSGPIDGDFDDDTQAGTIAYQQQNGLVANIKMRA